MKVAIILDYDGHVNCVEWNADNAARIVEVAASPEMDRERLTFNEETASDTADEERRVAELLAETRDAKWLERAADFINENFGGRSNGNRINVLEPERAVSRRDIKYWLT
jgi:hypothetical protein